MDDLDARQILSAKRLGELSLPHVLAASAGGVHRLHELASRVIEKAVSIDNTGSGSLDDIEHFVLLMNENRSFDHYYGTMSGVAGFGDQSEAFRQWGYAPGIGPTPDGYLNPFHLDTIRGSTLRGDIVNDPDHSWRIQHDAWHGGAMDAFVSTHLASDGETNGPAVMGYYQRADIPIHRALADAFTICDHYFCSVLGPTDPNRLFWLTGTIDPDGWAGGPLLHTALLPSKGAFSWKTYPECLQDHGVDWKIYSDQSFEFLSGMLLSSMMDWFAAYGPDSVEGAELRRRALEPTFPRDFTADVKAGTLPAVSWIIPSVFTCEHPALPPAMGALGILEVLDVLTSNPDLWAKTALIVSYDENGGFFDHVVPPTAPAGTPGEFISDAAMGRIHDAAGISGPVGLGFRVPCLVISPYSRGGLVADDVFDHTSQLRLLEKRFGVSVPRRDTEARVPGLSDWRLSAVKDLSAAFDFGTPPEDSPPDLPVPDPDTVSDTVRESIRILLATLGIGKPYPVPPNEMPVQETEPARRRPTGAPDPGPRVG